MNKGSKFKKGNKLIEMGKVYKVFKIEEKIMYYRPYFINSTNNTLICSIPEKNIYPNDLRKPVSKKELDEILIYLSEKPKRDIEYDTLKAQIDLKLNDIYETAKVLRLCVRERNKEGKNYTKTKKDVLNNAIEMMVEEVALVFEISLEEAQQKIKSSVNI